MKYSTIKFYGSPTKGFNYLIIDYSWWIYSTWDNRTTLRETNSIGASYIPAAYKTYILPLALELNKENPKETVDRFFKLLLLK